MNEILIDINTSSVPSGSIIQEIVSNNQTLWLGIMEIQRQQVREALIKLGWTPPKEAVVDAANVK